MEPIAKNELRFDLVCGLVKEKWKKFLKIMAITSVITYLIVWCIPRYYVVTVKLAPEYGTSSGGGSLGDAASMLGINLSSQGADAIVPEFYPDIVQSTDFLVPIMETMVETHDGEFKGTYGEYILKREKKPWWTNLYNKVKNIFVSKPAPYKAGEGDYRVDPFKLTKGEYGLLQRVSESIGCSVDEKSGVITLTLTAQDPLVAATMANAVMGQLQEFMTKYRTEKNKVELKHAIAMCDTAYIKYVDAQRLYADYANKHQGLSNMAFIVEKERLNGEMQLAFNTYNTLYQRRLMCEAEVQKRTPAFTVLQNASVPVEPTGPRRLLWTAVGAILSAVVYLIVLIVKNRRKRNTETAETAEEVAIME